MIDVHPDDPVKHAEHMAVLRYVDHSKVTHTVSGLTSGLTDVHLRSRLVVPEGQTLTVDSDTSNLDIDWIRVDGELAWIDAPAKLRITTLVFDTKAKCTCLPSSHLREISFSPRGPRDRINDPADISGGIIIHCKQFELFGEEKTAFAQPVELAAGSTKIEFQIPVMNWQPWDMLLIPGVKYEDADEFKPILSVDQFGKIIHLATPIQFNHKLPDGTWPVVGNLTRSFRISSESTERGHFMVMHEHAGTTLKHVAFIGMGRTDAQSRPTKIVLTPEGEFVSGDENTIGRYPVHFHGRTGMSFDVGPHLVEGCVIDGSPLHGLVNHGMHVEARRNITYDCDGSGLFTENGHELGLFNDNLCVFSKGRRTPFSRTAEFANGIDNFGFEGHGIWLQGPGVEAHGNHCYRHFRSLIEMVVAAHAEVGNSYKVANMRDGYYKQKLMAENLTIAPIYTVPTRITNNKGGGAKFGFFGQQHLYSFLDTESQYTDLGGNQFYNVPCGIGGHYLGHCDIRNCKLYGDKVVQNSASFGGVYDRVNVKNLRVTNCHIEGFHIGIADHGQSVLEVKDCVLKENVMDFFIQQIQKLAPHHVLISGCSHLGRPEMEAKYNTTPAGARMGKPADYFFQIGYPNTQTVFNENLFVPSEHKIDSRLIYYPQNAADFVLFAAGTHPDYGGKTNKQLMEQFGVAFMGRVFDESTNLVPLEGTNTTVWIEAPPKPPPVLTLEEEVAELKRQVAEIRDFLNI